MYLQQTTILIIYRYYLIISPLNTLNNSGVMAEWSKAIDLSSIIFGCAGSNPADTILRIYTAKHQRKKNFFFYLLIDSEQFMVLWPSWLRRRAYNAEVVGSSPTRTILKLDTMAEWLRRWT